MPIKFHGDEAKMNSNGYQPIPEGDYRLKVTGFEETKTSETDKPMFVLDLQPHDKKFSNKTLKFWLVIHPEDDPAHGLTIHALKQLGQEWKGDVVIDGTKMINESFEAHVVEDEYKGKKGNKIAYILSTRKEEVPDDAPF